MRVAGSIGIGSPSGAELECQVVSAGRGHSRLVKGGDGAIGTGLQAKEALASGHGDQSGENLHSK